MNKRVLMSVVPVLTITVAAAGYAVSQRSAPPRLEADQARAIIHDFALARAEAAIDNPPEISEQVVSTVTDTVLHELASDRQIIHANTGSHGNDPYDRADVEIEVLDSRGAADRETVVRVSELASLHLADQPSGGNEVSARQNEKDYTFTWDGNTWRISDVDYNNDVIEKDGVRREESGNVSTVLAPGTYPEDEFGDSDGLVVEEEGGGAGGDN